jgi:transcriptional regulator with XRE-family HTH domain
MPRVKQSQNMISDHKEEYKKIAIKLRAARKTRGLNQGRLSAKIDKSQSYISKVEAGKINIGAVELNLLAKIYKKPIEYFLS